ncbi:MAG: cation:proton antiporter [Bacteroidia bacterium]
MSTGVILIILCTLILVGYVLDVVAKQLRIPSVLLLIGLGVLVKLITVELGIATFDFMRLIPTIGTLGLILIVFEGGLDLEYRPEKKPIIRNALILSVVILVLTALGIAFVFQYFTGAEFYPSLVNAIPYSVISSAIAIPSASGLTRSSKEFITFESSFSDIFGIIFFNYSLQYTHVTFEVFGNLVSELTIVILVSLLLCVLLLYLLRKITHHVKFVMIIASMVLLYAIGKELHLSSLILVLIFGLLIRNVHRIQYPRIRELFVSESFKADVHLMHSLTAEGVFLIKTIFFVLFGFIIDLDLLRDPVMLQIGFGVLAVIYLSRTIALPMVIRKLFPELLFSPRGLISILLYLSIPEALKIQQLHTGLLFFTVLSTSLVMVSSAFLKTGK